MIREDQAKTAMECPLTATDDEINFANRHTEAVLMFIRKDFKGAVDMFSTIHTATPPHLLSAEAPAPPGATIRTSCWGKSVKMVEDLSVAYQQDCPADFDGVYRADEK